MKTYIDHDQYGNILRVVTAPENYPTKEPLIGLDHSPHISDVTHYVSNGKVKKKQPLDFDWSVPPFGKLYVDNELVIETESDPQPFSLNKENESDTVNVRIQSVEYIEWEGEL